MSSKHKTLLLVARIIIAVIFIIAGWMKVSNMDQTVGFFGTLGIPAFLAYIVSYAEFLGGIALLLGLWTDLATIGLGIIMLGAIWFTHKGGFPAFGMPLVTLASLIAILAAGPGALALRFKKKIAEPMA